MPTYDEEGQFLGDLRRLPPAEREKFVAAVKLFVDDLRAKRPFCQSLRVKNVDSHAGIFEMTWDWPDGRATFRYGDEQRPGEAHVIWRLVGGHEIFKQP